MATTVHIPQDLLRALDERARRMKRSRNRFIVDALKKALSERGDWSPGFLDALATPFQESAAVDELLQNVRKRRRSKQAPRL